MKSKKRRAPGAQLKKKRVPKYQSGGQITDVKDLLTYLEGYDASQYTSVPGSEYISPLQQVVNLPPAEVVTQGTGTRVNAMLPEQIARTEGDLAAVYQNLGSQGVTDYLDMTQGVVDAQNRAYEAIAPLLYFTPMGTPAFLNDIINNPEEYNPNTPEGALRLGTAMATMGRGKFAGLPQYNNPGVLNLRQGIRNTVRKAFGKDPIYQPDEVLRGTTPVNTRFGQYADDLASGLTPEGRDIMRGVRDGSRRAPSQSGMFNAMDAAAQEAQFLAGESAVLGRRALPSPAPLLEESGVINARNYDLGRKAGRQAAQQKGALQKLNTIPITEAVSDYVNKPLEMQQGYQFGLEQELIDRQKRVYYPDGYNPRTGENVSLGYNMDNVPQIPALSIGGMLEKRVNKQGMILEDQLDQFINKTGLSVFDQTVLQYARAMSEPKVDKKGRQSYALDDLRRNAANFMHERFEPTEDNTVDSYQSYGFASLGGRNKVPIGTKLIVADPRHELGSQYIGQSSGHWTGYSPNVVGHYRGFTHGDNLSDASTLYIGEMQSDVAQRGRFLNDPSRIPEGYPEQPLDAQYDEATGIPRYEFKFPDRAYDGYTSLYSSTRQNLPSGPPELFNRFKDAFYAGDYVPEGFDRYEHVKHVMEIAGDGVMTPENEYLYDVEFWERLGQGLRDANALVANLRPTSYRMANHFYNHMTDVADKYGMPDADRLNHGYITLEDHQRAAAAATDKIVDALEKNDTNPKGEFTDPYIQEEYDNAIEEYSDALENIALDQQAMEWVFSHEKYAELKPYAFKPLPDSGIQKGFVKNQDEFLLSQILLNEGHKYDVIRFPTGETTAIIQGYTRSRARIQNEINDTREALERQEGKLEAVENLLDANRDPSSDLPALFIKNKDNQFVPTRVGQLFATALSPELQELLFGAPLVNAQGQPIAHSSPDRFGTAKEIFANIDLYEINTNSLSQKLNAYGVDQILAEIESGAITQKQQEAAHIYNFIRFVSQVERGNVGRTEGDLLVKEIENTFENTPNHTVSLDDPVNNPHQSVLVGKILAYDRVNGTNLKAQFDKYMEADGMSGLYARLYKQVDSYAYGENLMQPPELTTEQILDGSWKRQPVWEDAINAGEIDRHVFDDDMTSSFLNYLKDTGYGRPYSYTEEKLKSTDYFIDQFVDKYTLQQGNVAYNRQRIAALMNGVANRNKPWGTNVGIDNNSYRYDYSMTFAQMPVFTSGAPYHPDFPPTRNLMTTDEVRALLSDFANKIESDFGGTARYRSLVSNPRDWPLMKNFVSEVINEQGEAILSSRKAAKEISSKEAHLKSLEDQLRNAMSGANLSSGQKTVVASYDNLDKVAKKLGYTLKKVEDDVGNEWWELDVPASLKAKSGEIRGYADGGRIKIKKRKPYKIKKRKPHNLIKK